MVNSSRHSVIEVLVPNEIIGAVIGRSGVNITEIQNKTSTRINFRDEGTYLLHCHNHDNAIISNSLVYSEGFIHASCSNSWET